ncbi:MAG TPA: hypothetical protein VGR16_04125 [Thermomicrobiales bacterium]|nr:hypothetical protein [Thermomicrobiales bacterium]
MDRARERWAGAAIGLTIGLLLAVASFEPDGSVAIQGTPAAGNGELRACMVEPRAFPIWDGTPAVGVEVPPVTTDGPFVPPQGAAADEATVEGITDTVEESIACTNAGEIRRVLSLFSDNRVRTFFAGRGAPTPAETESILSEAATPVPEADQLRLVTIRDVKRLPDGRAGAIIETRSNDTTFTDFVYFIKEDGRWLIDDSVAIDSSTQVGATPGT